MCNLDRIIDKCKEGDRQAAEKIYQIFSAKMFALCLRFSKDRADAEDTLQDGFIKIFTSIGQYTGKGSFEGWMKRIMINTAMEKFRKNSPLQIVEELPEIEDNEDIDEEVSIPEEVLADFVNQLPERYKMVFNLYVFENKSHKEIARMLNIGESSSASQFSRAKALLAIRIKEYKTAHKND